MQVWCLGSMILTNESNSLSVDFNSTPQKKHFFIVSSFYSSPTGSRAVLPSKASRWVVPGSIPVALVDLAVRGFLCFLRNSRKYWLGSLKKTPTAGTPPVNPSPACWQLAIILTTKQPSFYSTEQVKIMHLDLSYLSKLEPHKKS